MAVGGSYDPTAANVRSSFASLMKSFPEIKEVFFDEFDWGRAEAVCGKNNLTRF